MSCVLAQENLTVVQTKMKSHCDQRAQTREFKPGDEMPVLLPVMGNPLKARFHGPCEIGEVQTILWRKPGPRRYFFFLLVNSTLPKTCSQTIFRVPFSFFTVAFVIQPLLWKSASATGLGRPLKFKIQSDQTRMDYWSWPPDQIIGWTKNVDALARGLT